MFLHCLKAVNKPCSMNDSPNSPLDPTGSHYDSKGAFLCALGTQQDENRIARIVSPRVPDVYLHTSKCVTVRTAVFVSPPQYIRFLDEYGQQLTVTDYGDFIVF